MAVSHLYINDTNPDHTASDRLDQIHEYISSELDSSADEARAKYMESQLRKFKAVSELVGQSSSEITNSIELQALKQIIDGVGERMGIDSYKLFQNQHSWYQNSQSRWGADDVFEAELKAFLDIVAEKAFADVEMPLPSQGTGVEIVGSVAGNVSKEIMEKINLNANMLPKDKNSKLVNIPSFKSAKVDVTGYNTTLTLNANLKPEWQEFINMFAGARFTVKNYKGNSSYETIHLGNTNLYKSIIGPLEARAGLSPEQSIHTFYHATASLGKGNVNDHLLHLRFNYELTGVGLVDDEGNRLDDADFFIYNDSTSGNIYVRSTKAMIKEIENYKGNINDPLHSNIVILKHAFQ